MSLQYLKIEKVQLKGVASLLFLHKVRNPFKIPRPPAEDILYAGVLFLDELPWLLYEYSKVPLKATRRKV